MLLIPTCRFQGTATGTGGSVILRHAKEFDMSEQSVQRSSLRIVRLSRYARCGGFDGDGDTSVRGTMI